MLLLTLLCEQEVCDTESVEAGGGCLSWGWRGGGGGGGGGRSGEMCCHLPCCVSRKSVEAGGDACLGVGGGGGG